MTDLGALGADVEWPDSATAAHARNSMSSSLGRLDDFVEWLAAVQAVSPPHDFARARIVVFGSSACDNAIVELAGASVALVDLASSTTATAAIEGSALADAEIEAGADIFVVAVPGHDTAAATVVSVLTNTEPVKVLPRGATLPPDVWMQRAIAVRDGRRRAFGLRTTPSELLAEVDNLAIAAATGFLLRSAARRTPLLLDGVGALSAALVAATVQLRASRWWRAADVDNQPVQELALIKLGQRPLLALGVERDDGTAGALGLLALRTALLSVARNSASGQDA
ncbi:MAG: nicotinate-nucleotide--dimethylbenzimidazole phosphoribosyltransferase [Actinomycetota bacterium]|nr:nicotinate-nucleotide--dimethylbenzimidazole phosphoribosyltransferase [Actinomycetota bacterium]